ncbi:MAG: hypothetical protein HC860_00480, partial [Alkalinema sp. RU_4_3]|nr:hypothetical protein [Alkalinema sp. RU_4_3]
MKYSTIVRLITLTSLAGLAITGCQSSPAPKSADPTPPPSNIIASPPIAQPSPSNLAHPRSPKPPSEVPTGAQTRSPEKPPSPQG